MSFGKRLKTIRGKKSQFEFAKGLGVSRSVLQVWEYDKGTPIGNVLLKLYKKYNVNINWLVAGEGDRYVEDDQKYISLEERVINMEERLNALEMAIFNG